MTLYEFRLGDPGGPTGLAPSNIIATHPALLVPAGTVPTVGPGVDASKVATGVIPNSNGTIVGYFGDPGKTIVTYFGAPLYYSSFDKVPGDINDNEGNFQLALANGK